MLVTRLSRAGNCWATTSGVADLRGQPRRAQRMLPGVAEQMLVCSTSGASPGESRRSVKRVAFAILRLQP